MCLDQRVLGRVRNTHFLHQACVDVTINDKEKKKQLQNTTIYGYHTALDELMGKKFKPPEAVTWRRSVKKAFLEISQNSQRNTCA